MSRVDKTFIHDDGCGGTLDTVGRCMVCGLVPDMQSIAIMCPEVKSNAGHDLSCPVWMAECTCRALLSDREQLVRDIIAAVAVEDSNEADAQYSGAITDAIHAIQRVAKEHGVAVAD